MNKRTVVMQRRTSRKAHNDVGQRATIQQKESAVCASPFCYLSSFSFVLDLGLLSEPTALKLEQCVGRSSRQVQLSWLYL